MKKLIVILFFMMLCASTAKAQGINMVSGYDLRGSLALSEMSTSFTQTVSWMPSWSSSGSLSTIPTVALDTNSAFFVGGEYSLSPTKQIDLSLGGKYFFDKTIYILGWQIAKMSTWMLNVSIPMKVSTYSEHGIHGRDF